MNFKWMDKLPQISVFLYAAINCILVFINPLLSWILNMTWLVWTNQALKKFLPKGKVSSFWIFQFILAGLFQTLFVKLAVFPAELPILFGLKKYIPVLVIISLLIAFFLFFSVYKAFAKKISRVICEYPETRRGFFSDYYLFIFGPLYLQAKINLYFAAKNGSLDPSEEITREFIIAKS